MDYSCLNKCLIFRMLCLPLGALGHTDKDGENYVRNRFMAYDSSLR